MKLKTKRKAAASSQKYRGKQSYGIGGAVMTLGKNLLQGKKLGSGAFQGVLRAGITPGSGIGAGIGLAGALASKSKNPTMQKIGKGLGMAGNVAGMFTGGGGAGAGALGGLAGKFAGADKTLAGIGAASGGNPLMALAQNFIPGMSGANGMRVRRFDNGGEVEPYGENTEPLTNKEFRENEKFQRQAERQARPYERADDTEELLDMLENSENVDERAQILRQLVRMLGLGVAATGGSLLGKRIGWGDKGWINRYTDDEPM